MQVRTQIRRHRCRDSAGDVSWLQIGARRGSVVLVGPLGAISVGPEQINAVRASLEAARSDAIYQRGAG